MSQSQSQYTCMRLYEDTYNIPFDWKKWLPADVFNFHDLQCKEYNSPVSLQMGVVLPFISALLGPKTKGKFFSSPSVLNLFWINVAASGTGKSQSRERFISTPLQYIMANCGHEIIDFEVSKYTRAGIEDKLIATNGYCIMVTDEGIGFFDDIRKKERQHESDLGMLNQLYDGKGDKTTLAQNRERCVPRNSTAISVSLQQEAFITGLSALGKTLWLDNGFGERFIICAVKPYRHKCKVNKDAARRLSERYDKNTMGKVALGIYRVHKDAQTLYELNQEAEDVFETLLDKFNSQFNFIYSAETDLLSQSSQPSQDYHDKSDVPVRTKAAELIGRLTCVLWVYCNAFKCVVEGKDVDIPKYITADYVKNAEEIVTTSYMHAEKFASAIFSGGTSLNSSISKPKPSDRNKVVNALIKFPSPVVVIRLLIKNIRQMGTEMVKDELIKLAEEGYGTIVTREQMVADKDIPNNRACTVFLKPYCMFLKKGFFDLASDKELKMDDYIEHFNEDYDDVSRMIIDKFHPHALTMHPPPPPKPKPKPKMRTALDDLEDDPNFPGGPKTTYKDVQSRQDYVSKSRDSMKSALVESESLQNVKIAQVDNMTGGSDMSEADDEVMSETDVRRKSKKLKPHSAVDKAKGAKGKLEKATSSHGNDKQASKSKSSKKVIPSGNGDELRKSALKKVLKVKVHDIGSMSDTSSGSESILRFAGAGKRDVDEERPTVSRFPNEVSESEKSDIQLTQNDPVRTAHTTGQDTASESEGGTVSLIPKQHLVNKCRSKRNDFKVCRWNRPPPPRSEFKEVFPLRKSRRIIDLKKKNKENDTSSNDIKTTSSAPPQVKKRKLSVSQRNKLHTSANKRGRKK